MAELGRHRGEALIAERTEWDGDCLIWSTRRESGTYGTIRVGGKQVMAHRFAWEVVNGPIPPEMVIDHLCHRPSCVNVAHLRLATNRQNTQNKRGANRSNKLGVRNVHQRKSGNYQVAVRDAHGKSHGTTHASLAEAIKQAERLRAELHGEPGGIE